jgi:hypothetical protein
MLGWPHLIALIIGSILLGVAITTETHCNDNHPAALGTAQKTAAKLNITDEPTTAIKLNVKNNAGVPDTLPNAGSWPKVAWLMSFPNSGTSFTSQMVRHLSHMSTATNYGEEFTDDEGNPIPIHENSSVGPFWVDPQETSFAVERPTVLAFTKTHCGGRCEECGPSKYVENPHSFLTQCLSGKWPHVEKDGTIVKELVQYDVELVQRAVHLIRSPFDNVVSRFHLESHEFDDEKRQDYPNSRDGFRNFCFHLNTIYEEEEKSSRLVDPKVWQLMKDVPCRDDFFRFAQWHNLAFVTTQSLGIPTLVVHYESYETNYSETATKMVEFLHLPLRGELIGFFKGKEYIDYFSPAEQQNVSKAMKIMSLSSTWDQISHYFD